MQKIISKFTWAKKSARLRLNILIRNKIGGLALPDITTYAAVHLARIIDWCTQENTQQCIGIE